MIYEAIHEIKSHPAPEDIVVYRYISRKLLKHMLEWSNYKKLKKNITLFDKTFLSTTLTPEVVRSRNYAQNAYKLFRIYVPKDTPCLYLELISDMQENEVIFLPMTKLKIISTPIFSKKVDCVIENN